VKDLPEETVDLLRGPVVDDKIREIEASLAKPKAPSAGVGEDLKSGPA
jgi:hypothetical protein